MENDIQELKWFSSGAAAAVSAATAAALVALVALVAALVFLAATEIVSTIKKG